MLTSDDFGIVARLDAIERRLAGLTRLGERKRPRDGRAALTVRLGDQLIAQIRVVARQRGCSVSELMRTALETVIPPSSPGREHRPAFVAQKLDAARRAVTVTIAEQARLTAAGAATKADGRSRDQQARASGMLSDAMAMRPAALRGR